MRAWRGGRRGRRLASWLCCVRRRRLAGSNRAKPREGAQRSAGGWLAMCGPQAASRMAAKNSAHVIFASLFIGHRARQRAGQAPRGGGCPKRRYSRSCYGPAGGWGAYDTRCLNASHRVYPHEFSERSRVQSADRPRATPGTTPRYSLLRERIERLEVSPKRANKEHTDSHRCI